ncbi:MAG: serine hydrolase [Rhodothermales bacterium]|nr:serine hydrolase [Rhodothermales bacterium]
MRPSPLLAVIALLLAVQPASAQDRLRTGRTASGSLSTGDAVEFVIDARTDQFIYGRVNQLTVDVVVEVIGPDDVSITTVDGPARGHEHFQFETDDAGRYRVVVTPFEDEEGNFEITLVRQERVATDPGKRVDQLVSAYSGMDGPGVAIQVWRDGRTLFSKGYGAANLAYGIPYSPDTPTNIGSTSKQFTAFAIMLLVEADSLSLDDDVREYVPELTDFGPTVTIRHLLNHTTGYREFLNLALMDGRQFAHGDWIDRSEVIAMVQRQPALQNEPGAEFNYNNTAYALAAEIVARVSDMSFPDFMEKHVFEPLGMTGTMVRQSREWIVPGRSVGYTPGEGGRFLEIADLGGAMGAGGIYSTVEDLQKWAENLRNPVVGSTASVQEMQTSFVLTDSTETGYGLGLFIDEQRGLRRIHHGGADVAHRSQLARFPEINAGLTTQSNHAGFDGSLSWEIAELFFGDEMEPEEEEVEESGETPYDPADFDPETFDAYEGQFALDAVPAFVLTYTREDSQYYLQATGQPQFEIFPTSDSTFKLTVVEASMTFHRDPDGSVNRLTLHQNGNQPATRVDDGGGVWKPTAEDLSEFAGRYFSVEIETFYTVELVDDALMMSHRRLDAFELNPGSRDTFQGGFFSELSFERDRNGQVIGFYASNGRSRDVRFARQ